MTLGERISAQRTLLGWSQADLAERLDVSRQSVSKWETDASVPDLDKLVKLCNAFGMTLDQLVRGEELSPSAGKVPPEERGTPEEEPKETPPKGREKRPLVLRDIIGVALVGFGCLVFLLLSMWSGDLAASAVCASVFWVLGAVCLAVKVYTGLWCGWVIWGALVLYLRFAAGIMPHWIFAIPFYQIKGFSIHLLLAWGEAAALAALLVFTWRAWLLWKKRS